MRYISADLLYSSEATIQFTASLRIYSFQLLSLGLGLVEATLGWFVLYSAVLDYLYPSGPTYVPALSPLSFYQVAGYVPDILRFVIGTAVITYHGSIEAIIAHLPPWRGLARTVRFADDAFG